MAKGKRHSTPEELDHFFERDIIDEDDYSEFWKNWWTTDKEGRQQIIDELIVQSEGEVPGTVTKDIKVAEFQADLMDGYVVRRNSRGQFSRNGSFYQALPKRRKQ